MKIINTVLILFLISLTMGCSLEVESQKLQKPIDDKPVFKKLEKYKITGDFSVEVEPFEEYTASTIDDEGNLFLLGSSESTYSKYTSNIYIRGIATDGTNKLNFGQKGYLDPSSAISFLEAYSSNSIALSAFRKNGKSQLAVLSSFSSGATGNRKNGLKILFFSTEGKLLHAGPAIFRPLTFAISIGSMQITDQYIYSVWLADSKVNVTRSDHQGLWDPSFGENGVLTINTYLIDSRFEEFNEKSSILLSKNSNGTLMCHKLSSQGTVDETTLTGFSGFGRFKTRKLNDDTVLVVGENFRIIGIDKDCKVSTSINTTLSSYTSSNYALAGVTRFSNDTADLFLVKKDDRTVQKIHFNVNNVSNPPPAILLPKMQLAPGSEDSSFNYSAHVNGNSLTLISFKDRRTLPDYINRGYAFTQDTSIYRIDLDKNQLDPSWGDSGLRYLNEKTRISTLDTKITTFAARSHIYFTNSYFSTDGSYIKGEYVFRIGLNGKLDTSFGNNGLLKLASVSHIIETENLEVLIIYNKSEPPASSNILKLHADGTVDSNFGDLETPGSFKIPTPSEFNTTYFLENNRNLYFISSSSSGTPHLRSLNIDNGKITFDKNMDTTNRVIGLYSNNHGEIIVETASRATSSLRAKVFIHKVSATNGDLTLLDEITFDSSFPTSPWPSKGKNLYYAHSITLFPDVTFHLKTYNNKGELQSEAASTFTNLFMGDYSASVFYNGLPFAFGIFDGGSYFYGRVGLYNTKGVLYERVFDSIIIHKTLVSQTKQYYMIERLPKLTGDEYYLVILDSRDFTPFK